VLDNYRGLLEAQPFWSWFTISTVVALISTAVSVLLCSLAGFAFAKYRFRGRTALFTIMFSSLAVPFAVIVVPLFTMVAKARLTDPWFALVVPWVAPAFGIFMMRQFTEQAVPDEPLDAARIDGCTEFACSAGSCCPCCARRWARWACGRSSTATTACCGPRKQLLEGLTAGAVKA
jgi:multiple sugar transport system permease protein/arabinosaccharide transport system permease protein